MHSLALLRSQTSNHAIQASDFTQLNRQPDWMVYIVVAEWALKLGFRIHYSVSDVAALCGRALDNSESTSRQVKDFMNEFCNLFAGTIMRTLESNDRPIGMSLPVTNKSIEAVKPKRDQPPKFYYDLWRLASGDSTSGIVCNLIVEVTDPTAIGNLKFVDVPVNTDSSEVEFL